MNQIKKVLSVLLISMLISTSILNAFAVESAGLTIKSFNDVKESDWYYETLSNVVSKGIISGYPDGTFKPQNNVTRAEFTKILLNSLDIYISEGNSFQDTVGHWAEKIIYTAWAKGIIRKADFGTVEYDNKVNYYPDEEITRIEMSRMVIRAAGLSKAALKMTGEATEFSDDNEILSGDKGYALIANLNGIVNGYSDKTFKPDGKATRAEAAQILINTINTIERLKKEKENETHEDVVARVNENLQNRDVTIKLPSGIKSSAVHESLQCMRN